MNSNEDLQLNVWHVFFKPSLIHVCPSPHTTRTCFRLQFLQLNSRCFNEHTQEGMYHISYFPKSTQVLKFSERLLGCSIPFISMAYILVLIFLFLFFSLKNHRVSSPTLHSHLKPRTLGTYTLIY